MTILTVCQKVAPKIGLSVPSAVFTGTDREHVELQALANTMAKRIASEHDWQLLSGIATYTGDGSDEDFALVSGYDRMPKDAQVWSSELETPLTHITSRDRWLGLDIQSFDFVINAWIIYGNQIHIKPALASGVTAQHFYQSNLIIAPETGDNKTEFTLDTDSFRLDEELLKLGMLYQWKADHGQPYEEHMNDYSDLFERLTTTDAGAKVVRVGRARLPRGAHIAYPQVITP
jgi:hypothetical protein